MAFLDWSDAYSVRNKAFDVQHQKLFHLVSELHLAMFSKNGRETVAETIGDLIKYVNQHFCDEEREMEACGFPGLESHRKEHERLKKRVLDFQQHFHEKEDSMASELFGFLLGDWLVKHILDMDKEYAPYMRSGGS